METSDTKHCKMVQEFEKPPGGYGIVPFYWWLGDKLTKERIAWQIEKMQEHSVNGLQINYAHGFTGGNSYGLTLESDPPLFSEKWWELFEWLLELGKRDGFAVSLSDYTLGSPGQGWYTDEILSTHPDMAGYLLKEKHVLMECSNLENVVLPNHLLSIHIIQDKKMKKLSRETWIREAVTCGLKEVMISFVYAEQQPFSLNPMHPNVGKEVCKKFFAQFEAHAPGEGGKGLNFFFSDELNFGISGKLWDAFFREEFYQRKGYDICDYLPCLFWECGDSFSKIRLDYYDVIVAREEENYFKVIYDWHEERGMTYGCDHGGRGYNLTEFGDYFRTQKYNQGPGCDQPGLASDIIKNKVASSISHLYGRRRTWLEGFYGSGWGTSSGEFMDAVTRNFVMGHNLLSVHGMYYSTHGGWWEWAPPCNTWHMPYWDDMKRAFQAIERMSYMLSQGVHRCDVAVLYPVMAVEGSIDADKAVQSAFECVCRLYENGIDVDFIDFQSIIDADIRDGRMEKEGEAYRIIILPEMKTVRLAVISKLEEFCVKGGIVLGLGDSPVYCDTWDSWKLQGCLNHIIFGTKIEQILETVQDFVYKDVIFPDECEKSKRYMLHRCVDGHDFYMVYGGKAGAEFGFHVKGFAVFWNPYDGKRYFLPSKVRGDYTYVHLPLDGTELQLISFSSEKETLPIWQGTEGERMDLALSDEWQFSLVPCLDNRFGDYELPASDEMIGAQARALHGACSDSEEPNVFANEAVPCRCGFGPFYLKKGPFHTKEDYLNAIEEAITGNWSDFYPYVFSFRYGKWDDPGIQGYHGLKAQISDEFLTMGKKKETLLGIEYVSEEGKGYLFATCVLCEADCDVTILCGTIKPEYLFLDGNCIMDFQKKVKLTRGTHRVVACYDQVGRTYLLFAKGMLKKQEYPLSMTWYEQENLLPIDGWAEKRDCKYEWFWFQAPPAVESLEIVTDGETRVWIDGDMAIRAESSNEGDKSRKLFRPMHIPKRKCPIMIRIDNQGACHQGACFREPIRLFCGEGLIETGDWGEIEGLAFYSGKAAYKQSVEIKEEYVGKRMMLEIDDLSSSAKVSVNGYEVGVKVSAPWLFDITKFIVAGRNEIQILVSNTLTNHYRSIPTRYCGDAKSGILGQSRIWIYK